MWLQIIDNNERELFNEDVNTRHRFLFGVHISKDPEGIEGNVQLACGTIRKKKYERVERVENRRQVPDEQIEGNPQAFDDEQIENNVRDNG